MVGENILSVWVWDRQCHEDSERKDYRLTDLTNEDVFKTVPSTPGLLIISY